MVNDPRLGGPGLDLGGEGTAADSLLPVDQGQPTAASTVPTWDTRQARVRLANLRDRAHLLVSDVAKENHRVQGLDLLVSAEAKARRGVPALLEELAVNRGMSWSAIARLVGVTVGAVRKWRHDGATTGAHRRALARLTAFLDVLEHFAIDDPFGWLEMPLVDGYTVTGLDIYQARHENALLDYASHRIDVAELLTQYDPNWRVSYRTDFEVFEAGDGQLAIRNRREEE
jgi:hypothetical protein